MPSPPDSDQTPNEPSSEGGNIHARSERRSRVGSDMLFSWSTNAMGCEFQLITHGAGQKPVAQSWQACIDTLRDLESQLSIYRPESEMSHINRQAGAQAVSITPELAALLSRAYQLSETTDGAFDISAKPVAELWKLCRNQRRLPSDTELRTAREAVDFTSVQLDGDTSSTIRFRNPATQLDLGGIGKGHAIDCLGTLLMFAGADDFVIHGGQSSILARGQQHPDAEDPSNRGWRIGLAHPLLPHEKLGDLQLIDRAIGTSGSGRQGFVMEGRRFGHIVDPRTGWPPDHRLSLTVLAADATTADALATGLFVFEDVALTAWAEAHPDVAMLATQLGPQGRLRLLLYHVDPESLAQVDTRTEVVKVV